MIFIQLAWYSADIIPRMPLCYRPLAQIWKRSSFHWAVEAANDLLSNSRDSFRERLRLVGRQSRLCTYITHITWLHSTSQLNWFVAVLSLTRYHCSALCKATFLYALTANAVFNNGHEWILFCSTHITTQCFSCSICWAAVHRLSFRRLIVCSPGSRMGW